MFDDSVTGLLNQLIPSRQFIRRSRPFDPWFDRECRDAKRLTRRFRRVHANAVCNVAASRLPTVASPSDQPSTAVPSSVSSSEIAWRDQRRRYRELLDQKCSSYWQSRIEADRTSPKRLWRSIDTILGRGSQPTSDAISVDEFSH